MKWFSRGRRPQDDDELPDSDTEEFKPFHKTYRIISFALIFGLSYPNSNTTKFRFFTLLCLLVSIAPVSICFFIDLFACWHRRDYIEIIRHTTILGPFFAGFLQMFLVILKQASGIAMINELNRDYALYNHASPKFKKIVRSSVRNCLVYSEGWWTVTVLVTILIFPLIAAVLTLHSYLFHAVPKRYMIHELNSPFSKDPEARLESPYYEIMSVYMMYCVVLYINTFLGYDGFFGLCMNHACLKISMYCKALEEAMTFKTREQVFERLVLVIREQCRTYRYLELIQDFYNIWLGMIFLATMIQLCNLLYHVTEGYGMDVRYMIFIVGTTIHIFLPCHYASKLKAVSAEAATSIYCSGWENVHDDHIRKMVSFMIAREQIPHSLTAFNMVTFDMELFLSILQTSYSMYTLLSS